MRPQLGGGSRALFTLAESAVWLGMLICIYGPGGTAAAGLVR
jgi:hypothetical protein